GTKTVTFTILTEYGNLTYQIEVEVIDAAQVSDVQVNAAVFDEENQDANLPSANFNSQIQRSVLRSVVFTFNREMEDISTSDLSLKIIYQDGTSDDVVLNDASVSTADNTTFTLDMRNMTLTDGIYELTIKDTVVDAISLANLDGDADAVAGGDYVSDRFHQLGGDFTGDAVFNAADLGAVQYYWNDNHTSPPRYIDVNGDDTVDADDLDNFATWQASLDLTVEELVVESLAIESPSPQQSNMALALAAYQNQQASLNVVQSDDDAGDKAEYEDLIGQWLM
ncbi:MAG: dockerin type I domain-containing protein, partial [Phycisphaeraceae bacterium JB051]